MKLYIKKLSNNHWRNKSTNLLLILFPSFKFIFLPSASFTCCKCNLLICFGGSPWGTTWPAAVRLNANFTVPLGNMEYAAGCSSLMISESYEDPKILLSFVESMSCGLGSYMEPSGSTRSKTGKILEATGRLLFLSHWQHVKNIIKRTYKDLV